MAICKKCGGTIHNPKRCRYCGPQQGPRCGLRPVPSAGSGFWEQIMIYPPFGDVLRRFSTCRDVGNADIVRILPGGAGVYSYIHARFGPLNWESFCKRFSLTNLR
jgi:hypothetical protein